MILALEVDSDEQEPIGLFITLDAARSHIVNEEREKGADEQEITEFQTLLDDAVPDPNTDFDVQFESPFLSVDLRFLSIELKA